MEAVAKKYKGRAEFLFLYCREAHPDGDPRVKARTKKNEPIKQPTTIEERRDIAQQFCQDMKLTRRILVDEFAADSVQQRYGGRPNPTVVIGVDGAVALKMMWTNGEDLERFLAAFLAQGARFNQKLADSVPQRGGGGGQGGPDLARMIDNMLEGIELTEAEAAAARKILREKLQARGKLRQEALELDKLARAKTASADDLTRATKAFEDKVANLQKQVIEWDRMLSSRVSAKARAQLLAAGILENGLGFMGPPRPGVGPAPPGKPGAARDPSP